MYTSLSMWSAVSLKDLKNEVYFRRSELEMSCFIAWLKESGIFWFLSHSF